MHCSSLYRPPRTRPLWAPTARDAGLPMRPPVEAPVVDICVLSGSMVEADRASDRLGSPATMTVPQASHCVTPAFKFLPQFVQNVMDVVLYSVQKIYSFTPLAVSE